MRQKFIPPKLKDFFGDETHSVSFIKVCSTFLNAATEGGFGRVSRRANVPYRPQAITSSASFVFKLWTWCI